MEKPTRALKVHLMIKGESDREIKNVIMEHWNMYKYFNIQKVYRSTFESFVFNFDKYNIFKN
jgi:hypothetical protein